MEHEARLVQGVEDFRGLGCVAEKGGGGGYAVGDEMSFTLTTSTHTQQRFFKSWRISTSTHRGGGGTS
jgi:hypothetical protein